MQMSPADVLKFVSDREAKFEETTLNLRCDVVEPMTMQGYERDPRSLAKRAAARRFAIP
jgi:glutamine synthetase